ncbi:hypothetical protein [Nonomuraea wenchangensis]|uniref:Uncharacterized protein n=1 Tax=Nonomuraea wenchangensis TaxID=568860 RepID=A0A1I0F264_9ACTN|nr:hypothetical protein [Nonomuraea wenchangensis]SET52101.1 hypothetical protein SAMN05421811_103295 [Nonomuraea wenchangensis]
MILPTPARPDPEDEGSGCLSAVIAVLAGGAVALLVGIVLMAYVRIGI